MPKILLAECGGLWLACEQEKTVKEQPEATGQVSGGVPISSVRAVVDEIAFEIEDVACPTLKEPAWWLAPACLARHACLRHDGCHSPSGQCRADGENTATPCQEIRRIALKLAQRKIQPARVIAWSLWRRAHQAQARRAHLKRKKQL